MNGIIKPKVGTCPFINITPIDVNTRVIVSPAKWIVAHNGTTKFATSSETLFSFAEANVTGIVAADDWVPTAVRYAGIIVFNNFKGFSFLSIPAIEYWHNKYAICNPNNTA